MKAIKVFMVVFSLVITTTSFADDAIQGNTFNQSFNKAKKILLRQVYHDHHTTF